MHPLMAVVLFGSAGDRRSLQVLREELQRPRPRSFGGLLVVSMGLREIHKGVAGAGVGVKLVGLAQSGQFGVQFIHVFLRRILVHFSKVE